MRLLLLTYGTEGDTRPQVMLARGLIDAGHQVTLLGEGRSLATAQALALPSSPAGTRRVASWRFITSTSYSRTCCSSAVASLGPSV